MMVDSSAIERKPMLGVHHAAIRTADVERSKQFWRDGPGLVDAVHRITAPAAAGKTMPTAVITPPDGVLVELIGPAQ
ncbi:VOC family protein [Mycobacterium sp. E2497]|uniref:VOC family protein n=1 Tax=Mycobacterium sp. E2497 TaxID=1834135 RepID=UPI000800820B|nr:hypothetical protein [Mycobacterium sp. E2497]OBI15837.1 hypothetical protein A5713_23045 [Mycobacterium sp. E2497]